MQLKNKKTGWILALLMGLVSGGLLQAEEVGYQAFSVYRTATVPESAALRLLKHVQSETHLKGRNGGVLNVSEGTLGEVAKSQAQLPKEDEFIAYILHATASSDTTHAIFDTTNRVVVVNTTALAHAEEETFLRRLDRQGIRGFYFQLGLKPCPHPLCCLFPYNDTHGIDTIGRNACPPCQFRAQTMIAEKKIKVVPPALVVPNFPPKK